MNELPSSLPMPVLLGVGLMLGLLAMMMLLLIIIAVVVLGIIRPWNFVKK